MANLDLSESRRSQEGQFQSHINQQNYFIRVSIIATQKGEKVALRLLRQQRVRRLKDLHSPPSLGAKVEAALILESGLFLVCGATGAGYRGKIIY